jgi:two-component system sensor histidine kinase BaeS
VLKEQAQRLAQLVEGILNLSRLEMGGDRVAFAPVDLNALAEQVVVAHRPSAEAAGLLLRFEPATDLPRVSGEVNQLGQLATNLVANAIAYTPSGSVRLSTRLDAECDQVCLQVQDTGVGIDAEDMPHLFDRFYRGKRPVQANIPGTGLGLAIVKEIVDLHSGRIEVESTPDVGSTFCVWLPLARLDVAASEA